MLFASSLPMPIEAPVIKAVSLPFIEVASTLVFLHERQEVL